MCIYTHKYCLILYTHVYTDRRASGTSGTNTNCPGLRERCGVQPGSLAARQDLTGFKAGFLQSKML